MTQKYSVGDYFIDNDTKEIVIISGINEYNQFICFNTLDTELEFIQHTSSVEVKFTKIPKHIGDLWRVCG